MQNKAELHVSSLFHDFFAFDGVILDLIALFSLVAGLSIPAVVVVALLAASQEFDEVALNFLFGKLATVLVIHGLEKFILDLGFCLDITHLHECLGVFVE